jgi:hypothetical protein
VRCDVVRWDNGQSSRVGRQLPQWAEGTAVRLRVLRIGPRRAGLERFRHGSERRTLSYPSPLSIDGGVRGRLLTGIALAALGLALAPAASAYVPGGKLWPGGTIRYYNAAADQAWPVARAVWVWNHSGARIRFVPSSRADAQLLIDHFPHRRCVGHARATLGFTRTARVWLPRIDETTQACNSYSSAHAVAHELGHVLGLGHEERGCALMNPTGSWQGATLCPSAERWQWRCGLLEHDDVRGVVALYGGWVATSGRDCPLYAPMKGPVRLAAEPRLDQRGVLLRFGRPPLPTVPTFLAAAAPGNGGYAYAADQDRCPTDFTAARKFGWGVQAGGATELVDRSRVLPGRYCYAVWAFDAIGRPSDRPSWAWVHVTQPLG